MKNKYPLGLAKIIALPKGIKIPISWLKRDIARAIGEALYKYKEIEFEIIKLENGDKQLKGEFWINKK